MLLRTTVYLISSFISIECAFAVYLLNKRSLTNIIYFILAADFAACSIVLCHITSASDPYFCSRWYSVNIPFGVVRSTILFHFTLLLTGNNLAKNKCIIAAIYASPVAFSISMIKGYNFVPVFIGSKWGWEPVLLTTSIWTHLLIVIFLIPSILSFAFIVYWRSTLSRGIQYELSKRITFSYIAGMAGIFLCPYFWYFKGYDTLNMTMDMGGNFLFLIFLISLKHSLKKLKSFQISSETSAGELITGLDEPVFLVMKGGKIVSYNKSGSDLIDVDKVNEQSSIYNIFDCPVALKNIVENMFAGNIRRSEVRCSISAGKKDKRSFNLNIQSIINHAGELTGVMVFLKEDFTIGTFKKCFSITDRQLDIIFMVVSGMSNRHIAEKLGITEKTIENHLFNIYNKLGIDNKIELFNLTMKYNIIPN